MLSLDNIEVRVVNGAYVIIKTLGRELHISLDDEESPTPVALDAHAGKMRMEAERLSRRATLIEAAASKLRATTHEPAES